MQEESILQYKNNTNQSQLFDIDQKFKELDEEIHKLVQFELKSTNSSKDKILKKHLVALIFSKVNCFTVVKISRSLTREINKRYGDKFSQLEGNILRSTKTAYFGLKCTNESLLAKIKEIETKDNQKINKKYHQKKIMKKQKKIKGEKSLKKQLSISQKKLLQRDSQSLYSYSGQQKNSKLRKEIPLSSVKIEEQSFELQDPYDQLEKAIDLNKDLLRVQIENAKSSQFMLRVKELQRNLVEQKQKHQATLDELQRKYSQQLQKEKQQNKNWMKQGQFVLLNEKLQREKLSEQLKVLKADMEQDMKKQKQENQLLIKQIKTVKTKNELLQRELAQYKSNYKSLYGSYNQIKFDLHRKEVEFQNYESKLKRDYHFVEKIALNNSYVTEYNIFEEIALNFYQEIVKYSKVEASDVPLEDLYELTTYLCNNFNFRQSVVKAFIPPNKSVFRSLLFGIKYIRNIRNHHQKALNQQIFKYGYDALFFTAYDLCIHKKSQLMLRFEQNLKKINEKRKQFYLLCLPFFSKY